MLPILYQSPELIIFSYPLLMGLGWGTAYQIFTALQKDIPSKYVQLLFWGIFVFAWIGAKVLFLLTADLTLPSNIMSHVNFWTGGGFVFYGGFLGALVFLLFYKLLKFPLNTRTMWAMLPALTLGHAVGRLGCFLAGCCFGDETTWWWGMDVAGVHRHPTQLLEALGLSVLAYVIWKVGPRLRSLATYLVGYGVLRFLLEILRGDEIRGLWGPLTPSQWISVGIFLVGVMLANERSFKGLSNRKEN